MVARPGTPPLVEGDLVNALARGDRVTVRWPGGPHSYVLEFDHIQPERFHDGWVLLAGRQIEPEGMQRGGGYLRTFYVRPVADGVFTLHPRGS